MPLVPVLILQLARSVGIAAEMQPAASSLMGMAVNTGAAGFVLGTLLHFFVPVVPAALARPHIEGTTDSEAAFSSTSRNIPHSTRRRSSLPPSFFDLIDLIGCHSLGLHHKL